MSKLVPRASWQSPPSLCRSEPYRAAFWLPGEDQPNAQLDLQHRESHSENVASPRRELWAEAGWDWRHDRRHAAVRPHQHGRLQHPRTAHQTGANRAIGCCWILVCRHSGVGTSNASSWTSRDILTCLPAACTSTSEVWFQLALHQRLWTKDHWCFFYIIAHNSQWEALLFDF